MSAVRLGLVLLALGSCGGPDQPSPAPEPTPEPVTSEAPLEVPRGRNLHVRSELIYEALPDAPHRLLATYQGLDLARWAVSREADEDGDRRVEYRAGERVFLMPKDSTESLEFGPGDRERTVRRMELRRLVMTMGIDAVAWDAEGGLDLAGGIGRVEVAELEGEVVELTMRTPEGASEETIRVTAWQARGEGRRPAELELWFGGTRIWTETVVKFEVESWFKPRYFWPPDRADEVGEDA